MTSTDDTPATATGRYPDGTYPPLSPLTLFVAFSQMALSGFGGVLPFAYRHIVERRKWQTPAEFAEMLAWGQVLPGPTICNVSVMIGWKRGGLAGALAALAGMVAPPMVVVIAAGALYQRFDRVLVVQQALRGMSAVAAGLILATAIKMGIGLFDRKSPRAAQAMKVAYIVAAFIGVGLAHWPMVAVVGVLGTVSTATAVWRRS